MANKIKYDIEKDVMTVAEQKVEARELAFRESIGVGKDWVQKQLRWMPIDMFIQFVQIIGEENLVIFNNRQNGDVITAEIFISPDGIYNGNEWNKKYKSKNKD